MNKWKIILILWFAAIYFAAVWIPAFVIFEKEKAIEHVLVIHGVIGFSLLVAAVTIFILNKTKG